ncbi:MAG: hypothetical protein CMJ32_10330 [Phycisphaerae bacterium]|nr:hypothetical protein [Phycisphaerae bacterium]
MATDPDSHRTTAPTVITMGFATTVGMWFVGYVCMTSPGLVVGEVLFVAMLVLLVAGGLIGSRLTARWSTGFKIGFVTATVNLLLIGALASEDRNDPWVLQLMSFMNHKVHLRVESPSMLAWIAGSYGVSILLCGIGGLVGARMRPITAVPSPSCLFAIVASSTVFLLLITGGLVTGLEAGLAVPDWPNSFGHNMLLYPLSEMTGGIYYEHAHRLYGMLVGLTVLVMTVLMFACERRRWIGWLTAVVLLMVCLQGLMGGLRVTGTLTLSQDATQLSPSTILAIIHGVFGQVVFCMLVLIAAFTSRTWLEGSRRTIPGAVSDTWVSALLVLVLLVQLVLGACYRHLHGHSDGTEGLLYPAWALYGHAMNATLVLIVGAVCGLKCWSNHREIPIVRRTGASILILIGIQLLLGVGALIVVLLRRDAEIPIYEVIVTTVHQATGALLLAMAVLLLAWNGRLLEEAGSHAAVSRDGLIAQPRA